MAARRHRITRYSIWWIMYFNFSNQIPPPRGSFSCANAAPSDNFAPLFEPYSSDQTSSVYRSESQPSLAPQTRQMLERYREECCVSQGLGNGAGYVMLAEVPSELFLISLIWFLSCACNSKKTQTLSRLMRVDLVDLLTALSPQKVHA